MQLTYYDRKRRRLMVEKVYAEPFLFWSYNSRAGRILTGLLLRRRMVTCLFGWYHQTRWSQRKIRSFVKRMNVNVDEITRPFTEFNSFNDFFTRDIDLLKRPIHHAPGVCVAPADGKMLVYRAVSRDRIFRIKSALFNLEGFLRNDKLVERFSEGSMVISRLSFTDYHHFHFPDSGIPGKVSPIRGKYYASGPYALRWPIPFYTENYRELTRFQSDHFGEMLMVEVGAFTVGSIRQQFRPGCRVVKGDRKGHFELGGSTVVLLFQKNSIHLDEDLCAYTKRGIESYVRMGEPIGIA